MQKIKSISDINFKNIRYICRNFTGSKKIFNFDELLEYPYYSQIIIKLKDLLKSDFDKYDFLIYSKIVQKSLVDDNKFIPKDKQDKLIVFYISDETGYIPTNFAKKCKIIFKTLIKMNSNNNVYYFPLGYANGLEKPIIPIQERENNVFFVGQLGRSRINLYKSLTRTKYIPSKVLLLLKKYIPNDLSSLLENSIIKFTTNFNTGFKREEYNKILYNSKIVICPYGAVTAETFRHYEAMRAGCIVITLKMPKVFPFENAPIIQLNNWDELLPTVKSLLKNPTKLEDLHLSTLQWWREKCSEESVANYIAEKILNKSTY